MHWIEAGQMLVQKIRPEETIRRRRRRPRREELFQMGQILQSSGSSKMQHESKTQDHQGRRRLTSCSLLLLLLSFSAGISLNLVGAIPSTDAPLNLNANMRPGHPSVLTAREGDELGASEGDVFHSSSSLARTDDYHSASKLTSNGQFARSPLMEKTISAAATTTAAKLSLPHREIMESKTSPLRRPSNPPTRSVVPSEFRIQSNFPLSPIVIKDWDDNAKLKSNLGTPHHSPKEVGQDALDRSSSTSSTTIDSRSRAELFLYPKKPTTTTTSSEETGEKPTNINLLRKLWSSTRSSKLNLTHEQQSLLRIESDKSHRPSSSSPPNDSGRGANDKELSTNSNVSRSILDLAGASLAPWTTTSSHPTPNFISPSLVRPMSVELTPLKPMSLKLEQEVEDEETSSRRKHSWVPPSDAPETSAPLLHPSVKLAFNDGTELSTSAPPNKSGPRDNKFPTPGGRRTSMLYPEWLSSSGGVYPDDSTNGTGEYYGEPEYENLINNNENNRAGLDAGGGNPGEREEEAPGRKFNLYNNKKIHTDFLDHFMNLSSWQNRLKLKEQQVLSEREHRMAASPSASDVDPLMSTEAPEAIIAQNGLADVISRGRIDSVMYVYFGDRYSSDYHKEEVVGRIIQAVGGVIAAIAQVLTVLGTAKCVRKSTHSNQPPIHLHIGFALLISNLLLLLAVHATEPADVCNTVAMILHYLHLVIGCWLFAHTIRTYLKLRRHAEAPDLVVSDSSDRPGRGEAKQPLLSSHSLRYCSASWTAPLPFIFMSYLANPDGYETRHYCWMSIEKGMVISFIVPVFLLIGSNTFLVVLSLRHLLAARKLWADSTSAEMDEDTLDERKISGRIRASAMLLPLLSIMWFLGVVSLENASSIFFQIASASANILLSWLILYFLGDEMWPELWSCCTRRDQSPSSSLFSTDDGGCQPGAHLSFDNEPLLAASSTSTVLPPLPSTSSAYGIDVGHSVCKPATASSSSSSSSKSGVRQCTPGMYAPIFPGPSNNRPGKRQAKSSRRPNWSIPGGSEIYELKMDSISTIS